MNETVLDVLLDNEVEEENVSVRVEVGVGETVKVSGGRIGEIETEEELRMIN